MHKKIALIAILSLFSSVLQAKYSYVDYADMRDLFEKEKSQINIKIDKGNRRYIRSLNLYQSCSSDIWRVVFITVIPEIDKRRLALGDYKRKALKRSGLLNSEWLKTAKEHNISQVRPDQDISDYFFWYQSHIELARQGPLHELEVYTLALAKLTGVYEKMASACSGSPGAAKDFSLIENGIRGLLDEVFGLIGGAGS